MKKGASDPFADTDDESTDQSPAASDPFADVETDTESPTESMDTTTDTDPETTAPLSRDDIPLTLRRDKVKDERPEVHQLFVQDDTDRRVREAEGDLEARLGEDVYRLDAREAIYLAGLRHLDDAEQILREWGYDL